MDIVLIVIFLLCLGGFFFFLGMFALIKPSAIKKFVQFKDKKVSIRYGLFNIIFGIVLITFAVIFIRWNSAGDYSYSNSSKEVQRCTICGGEMKCAICGESGPYCENASYGSGSDHYCNKHWGDVVEWHEEHDSK